MKIKKLLIFVFLLALIWQIILFMRLDHFLDDSLFVPPWLLVKKGLLPYQDFSVGSYFPFTKFLMLVILTIFGWDPKITAWSGSLLIVLTLILLYFLSKRFFKGWSQLLPIVFFSIWQAYLLKQITFDTSLFIGTLLLLTIWLFYEYLKKPSFGKALMMGVFSSLLLFSQQITIVPITLIFLSTFFYQVKISKNSFESVKKFTFPYSLGAFLFLSPFFFWLIKVGVFNHFLDQTILFYLDPNRYPFQKLGHSLFDLVTLTILNIPVIFLLFTKKENLKERWFNLSLILLIFFINLTIVSAVLHPRRYLYLLPTLSFIFGRFLLKMKPYSAGLKIIYPISIILSVFFFVEIVPWYATTLSKTKTYAIRNELHPGEFEYKAIKWIKNNTSDSSTIQIMGPMLYYYYTDRRPASNKTYSGLPWTYQPIDKTLKYWQDHPADYWLIDQGLFRRYQEWGYNDTSEKIRKFLQKNYREQVSFGYMSIYKKQ